MVNGRLIFRENSFNQCADIWAFIKERSLSSQFLSKLVIKFGGNCEYRQWAIESSLLWWGRHGTVFDIHQFWFFLTGYYVHKNKHSKFLSSLTVDISFLLEDKSRS
jgi:hypothetical protein